jgi:DNA-binding PadR family transcriptional regulator
MRCMATSNSLQHDLLDLLVDGPSSLAALFGSLVRNCGRPADLPISEVMDILFQMERDGWVRASQMDPDGIFHQPVTGPERLRDRVAYEKWLPNSRLHELSVDEVGLWYEITETGRAEWRRTSQGKQQTQSRWMIDDLRESKKLVVYADKLETAKKALDLWLLQHRGIELKDETEAVVSGITFSTRNGTRIEDGVRITYEYELSLIR